MSKVLIVDDEPDILDVLEFTLESETDWEVHQARSGQEAIELIKKNLDYRLVICDYKMSPGSGGDVFQYLKKEEIPLPFVLCSSEYPDDKSNLEKEGIFFHIIKPNLSGGVSDLLKKIEGNGGEIRILPHGPLPENLGSQKDSGRAEERAFIPIAISLLHKIGPAPTDIFVKLSERKFVKFIHRDDLFDSQDLEKFQRKQVKQLFVEADQVASLSKVVEMTIHTMISNKEISKEEKVLGCHALISNALRDLGPDKQVQELTKKNIDLALNSVAKAPKLNDLLKRILNSGDFPAKLYALVSYLSASVAKEIGWESEGTLYKLTMAAFMQDIFIPDPQLVACFTQSEFDELFPEASEEDEEKFFIHPKKAGEFIRNFDGLPPDIDKIVEQAHELPTGDGFPQGVGHLTIAPLAALLCLCNFVARELILYKGKKDMQAYLQQLGEEKGFKSGNFKKPFNGMLKINF